MKRSLLFVLSAFCFGACSVDTLEIEPELTVLDVTTSQVNGCAGMIWNLFYVKIIANGDYELLKSNLHIASDISGFPTTGNGGINLNKMDFQKSFNSPVKEYTYTFPLNSYGDSFLVITNSEFQLEKRKNSYWAGDLSGNQWSYFGYNLYKHPNAGADHDRTISLSAAQALPSWDEVRKTYTAMLDPGVPESQKVGSFEPTILDIINRFNDPLLGGVGEYTTVYTIGEGVCKDSVILTLKVVAG